MATNKDFIVKNGLSVGEDISVSGSVTSNLQFDNSVQAQFGTNSDLQIYSDGNNSYVKETGAGALVLQSAGPAIVLEKTDGTNMVLANTGGEVILYHAGNPKLETTSTGVDITGNAVLTGELRGPASFVIDPAAVGNNTGAVVIKGDLTVQGTTTTVNSTTLDVADKNITLNHGSGNTTATADGAGITIQDAVSSGNDASILWDATNDKFDFSHNVNVENSSGAMIKVDDTNGRFIKIRSANSGSQNANISSYAGLYLGGADNASHMLIASNGDVAFNENNGGSPQVGMHWDYADGYLGIGLTAPSSELHVRGVSRFETPSTSGGNKNYFANVGTGGQDYWIMSTSNANGSLGGGKFVIGTDSITGTNAQQARFTIDGSGKVGIGTDTPETNLDVRVDSNVAYATTMSGAPSYVPSASDVIQVRNTETGVDDIYAGIWFETGTGASNTTGTDRSGRIALVVDNDSSYSSNFVFQTRNSAGALTEKVRITNDGNVGIGTGADVDELLHIEKSSGTTLVKTEVAANSTVGLEIAKTGTTTQSWRIVDGQTVNGALEFYDLTNTATRMLIRNGNVGIGGILNPSARLHVVGPAARPTDLASLDTASTAQFQSDTSNLHSLYIAENASGSTIQVTDGATNSSTAKPLALQPFGGEVGIGTLTTAPTATLQVGNLVSGETGNVIINSEGGNPVGLKVASRTNRARIQVSDNDTSGFIIAEGSIFSFGFADQASDNNVNITDAYDVGIGTQTPAHKLDVVGAIGASQVRHSILPSLHLDFASSKHLDSRITFYRDSVGSYIDSTGVLRYASPNEPRFDHDISTKRSKGLLIEEQRENLLYYSSVIGDLNFASGWVNSGSNPIRTTVYADVAPDGTATATLISNLINSNTDPDVYLYHAHNLNGGELITYSIWVKAYTSANVGKHVEIRGKRIGGSAASFTKVATLTNEWQRVEVSCQYNADNNNQGRLYLGSRTNYGNFTDDDGNTVAFDAASEALFWGAQAEEGAFATSYIPTRLTDSSRSTTATYQDKDGVLRYAGKNEPRYGYKWDGQKYAPIGLLVEQNATNIAPQTETIGSAWYTTSYSKQDVRITLPNGTVGNAVKVIMAAGQSASSATALGFYIGAFTRQTGLTYNTSFFAKSNDENGLRIRDGLRTGAFLDINLNNGEIVANNATVFYDVMVEKYAHGWWRISYNYDSTSSGTGGWHAIRSYNNGDGSKGFLFWGAQLTTTSYNEYFSLSSYIPNPGGGWGVVTRTADVPNAAPATRYQDVAQIRDMQYADWNREEEGTFYVEHETPYDIEDISVNYRILERHNNVTGDSVSILHNSSTDQLNAGSIVGAGWQALMGVSSPYGEVNKNTVWKTALGFKEDDFGVSVQGSPIATDNSGLVPRGNDTLSLGDNWNSDNTLNGHLKLVKFYPERLSNAELVALTENN